MYYPQGEEKMNILLLAHPYLDLYTIIVEELIKQGHSVTVLKECKIPGDPYYKCQNKYKRKFLIWKWKKQKKAEKYWIKKFKLCELNRKYDLLFVIQGCTFHPILLQHLKIYNPEIKTSLYIWDTNRMYDFFRNVRYFENVYSFDLKDVELDESGKVKFLPFFWSSGILKYDNLPVVYDISSIGTNHDGRYFIYKKLIRIFKEENISFYVKLILSCTKWNLKDYLLYFNALLQKNSKIIELLRLKNGTLSPDFLEHKLYSPDDLCRIMAQSKAILDTDNELQYGTTPRLIWALALNKQIYTTNKNVKEFPFYDESYVHIIDRNNPVIDLSLMSSDCNESRNKVEYLRIDNWIQNFI